MAAVLSNDELKALVAEWRAAGLSIGFTCGAFDLLHAGHAAYLARARAKCDRLIVAVNSDDSVRSYKGPLRPIIPEQHRMTLVAGLASVDAVTPMPDRRPARLLELLKPDFYIKGGDYPEGSLRSAPVVEAYGGQTIIIPVEHTISTSEIVHRIEDLAIHAAPEPLPPRPPPRIVFLDRDGTILEQVHFLKDPSKVELIPGAGEALRRLQDAGFLLVVITNQQGLGLGYFIYDDFVAVNSEMFRQLSTHGVHISRVYFCPHSLSDQCSCRKPGTKLIERALEYYGADPKDCYLLGDSASDLEAATGAGCKPIQVTAQKPLKHAVDIILGA